MGTEAAASAVMAGEPARAVELLEIGRGVLWNQLLEGRADLGRLRVAAPDLAERLAFVAIELDGTHHK